jgi:hypothetical protein
LHRLARAPAVAIGIAEIVDRIDVVGLDAQRLAIGGDRLVMTPQFARRATQHEPGQRLAAFRLGPLPPQFQQTIPVSLPLQ